MHLCGQLRGISELRLWDFAGQEQFYPAKQAYGGRKASRHQRLVCRAVTAEQAVRQRPANGVTKQLAGNVVAWKEQLMSVDLEDERKPGLIKRKGAHRLPKGGLACLLIPCTCCLLDMYSKALKRGCWCRRPQQDAAHR